MAVATTTQRGNVIEVLEHDPAKQKHVLCGKASNILVTLTLSNLHHTLLLSPVGYVFFFPNTVKRVFVQRSSLSARFMNPQFLTSSKTRAWRSFY